MRSNRRGTITVGLAGAVLASLVIVIAGQQAAPPPVAIDPDDIGGVVAGAQGPEAGVWVIAESNGLPTRLIKSVVTDDRELARACARIGAKTVSTAWLIERMNHAERRKGHEHSSAEPSCKFNGPSEIDVDGWVQEFGDLDEKDFGDDPSKRGSR